MSKFEDNIYTALKDIFPYTKITRQLYVNYNSVRLFFDFYIRRFNIFIECQGDQHFKFNRFMHGNIFNFIESERRDKLKVEYVDSVGGTLVILTYKDHNNISSDDLIEVIHSYVVGGKDGT